MINKLCEVYTNEIVKKVLLLNDASVAKELTVNLSIDRKKMSSKEGFECVLYYNCLTACKCQNSLCISLAV